MSRLTLVVVGVSCANGTGWSRASGLLIFLITFVVLCTPLLNQNNRER
jgi:hypothetical protein